MSRTLEAIYEDGVLKPLTDLGLSNSQRVVFELHEPANSETPEYLNLCHRVYEGLSDKDVDEIEAIVLDRSHFRHKVSMSELATALVNGLDLLTENAEHFKRVPELQIESWRPSSG